MYIYIYIIIPNRHRIMLYLPIYGLATLHSIVLIRLLYFTTSQTRDKHTTSAEYKLNASRSIFLIMAEEDLLWLYFFSLPLSHTIYLSLPPSLSLQDDAYITYFHCYSVVVLHILYFTNTHTNNITNSHTTTAQLPHK